MLLPPDPVPPPPWCIIFSNMSCHSAISLKDCYPEVPPHFDVFSGCSGLLQLVQSRVQTDYHHSSGKRLQVASPSHSNMWVAVIRAVNRFWSASPPSFSSFALAFLCTPSVIQKEPRSRQTRHTHVHTHQITAYDWSQAVCLSSLEAMTFQFLARLCLFSAFTMFQAPWILIYFNPH